MGNRASQNFNNIKIIDDFFDNPDEIRKIAMECEYNKCEDHIIGGNWPGIRSDYIQNVLGKEVFDKMMYRMFNHIYPGRSVKKYYMESFFHLCGEDAGDSWIHQDMKWCTDISIIYLTPNPPKHSGTTIYEPIDRGFDAYNLTTQTNFKRVETIDNVYNRMVSYDPLEFHKSDTYFGQGLESRLTIVSFFRVEVE